MAYQALYRKWRPQTFSQVLGQTAIVKTLRRQIETGHIAHAYLFCGCRGTGKTTIAKIMSRAINCLDPQNGEPCGECVSCRAIMNETGMDVVELDAASNNGVDNVRDILEQIHYPPQFGKYKVYIIDEVHMLSNSAFNALLKTLEEPPAHVVFILATTEPQKLPATILSRVQRYDFGRISSELMIGRMKEALAEMGITAEEEALHMVARAAEGAMRDAFSILDMCVAAEENGRITAEQTRDILGTSDREFLFSFYELLALRDTTGLMLKIDELMRSGREPLVFLRELSDHTRSLLTVKAVREQAASVLDITEEDEKRFRAQAQTFSQQRLLRILDLFIHAESELRYASTPRIGLESTVLHACEENLREDGSAILERVAELQVQDQLIRDMRSRIAALEDAVANGQSVIPAARKKAALKAAETGTEKPNTNAAEAASKPVGGAEVWAACTQMLAKQDPVLMMLLHGGKFVGEENGVFRYEIPLSKKALNYTKLTQPDSSAKISAILSEVSGKPAHFEAVLEGNKRPAHDEAQTKENEQSLFDAFGRERVQIDEGERP